MPAEEVALARASRLPLGSAALLGLWVRNTYFLTYFLLLVEGEGTKRHVCKQGVFRISGPLKGPSSPKSDVNSPLLQQSSSNSSARPLCQHANTAAEGLISRLKLLQFRESLASLLLPAHLRIQPYFLRDKGTRSTFPQCRCQPFLLSPSEPSLLVSPKHLASCFPLSKRVEAGMLHCLLSGKPVHARHEEAPAKFGRFL